VEKGDSKPDETEKARLRNLALGWLKEDLAQRAKRSGSKETMRPWKQDPDFAGVRGDKALAALPEVERKEWTDLWGEVAKLLEKTNKK
jgi:hypothetical protein